VVMHGPISRQLRGTRKEEVAKRKNGEKSGILPVLLEASKVPVQSRAQLLETPHETGGGGRGEKPTNGLMGKRGDRHLDLKERGPVSYIP